MHIENVQSFVTPASKFPSNHIRDSIGIELKRAQNDLLFDSSRVGAPSFACIRAPVGSAERDMFAQIRVFGTVYVLVDLNLIKSPANVLPSVNH